MKLKELIRVCEDAMTIAPENNRNKVYNFDSNSEEFELKAPRLVGKMTDKHFYVVETIEKYKAIDIEDLEVTSVLSAMSTISADVKDLNTVEPNEEVIEMHTNTDFEKRYRYCSVSIHIEDEIKYKDINNIYTLLPYCPKHVLNLFVIDKNGNTELMYNDVKPDQDGYYHIGDAEVGFNKPQTRKLGVISVDDLMNYKIARIDIFTNTVFVNVYVPEEDIKPPKDDEGNERTRILKFLGKAKINAYAGSAEYKKVGNALQYDYINPEFKDLTYSDCYSGSEVFSGAELVCKDGVQVFAMTYAGKEFIPFSECPEALAILKKALSLGPSENRWNVRGPRHYEQNGLKYFVHYNRIGDDYITGTEFIVKTGDPDIMVFRCDFQACFPKDVQN